MPVMELVKVKCQRDGFEGYYDIYLVWRYDNKVFARRVRPCFNNDLKCLLARAIEVNENEPFEKYL